MKKITEFVISNCFTIMLAGMFVAVSGVITYMFINTPRYAGTPLPHVVMAVAIVGFTTYFIGRVGLVANRRRAQRRPSAELESADENNA